MGGADNHGIRTGHPPKGHSGQVSTEARVCQGRKWSSGRSPQKDSPLERKPMGS